MTRTLHLFSESVCGRVKTSFRTTIRGGVPWTAAAFDQKHLTITVTGENMSGASKGQSSTQGRKGGGGSGPKKESILELQKLMDASVRVKCIGGRELEGVLRGYDDLVNLVLDECDEYIRGKSSFILLFVK